MGRVALMDADNKWIPGFFAGLVLVLLMICSVVAAYGENARPGGIASAGPTRGMVIRNGYTIEIFDSAEDQLRYARAWFSDPGEKKAALEVLIEQYPEAILMRAEAELELAYLALGSDYRFADKAACLRAVDQYQLIADQFSELPSVCAKAHWYMGWIYADLLGQRRTAVAHFQTIVDRYPDATLKLEPPVPWVSLVLPQVADKPQTVYERPVYSWRSMALLEIVRNAEDEDGKWSAFETLWSVDLAGAATGYALRNLLHGSPVLAQKAAGRARFYLQSRLFNQPMAEEIRQALSRVGLDPDSGSGKMP